MHGTQYGPHKNCVFKLIALTDFFFCCFGVTFAVCIAIQPHETAFFKLGNCVTYKMYILCLYIKQNSGLKDAIWKKIHLKVSQKLL